MEKNHIGDMLATYSTKEKYDAEVKKILSDKTILAWILKYTVEEFKDFEIETIKSCIEGEPEVSKTRVYPNTAPEAISGMNTEDSVPGEGSITYDIKFYARVPSKDKIKLIINIEAQNDFSPGYDIVTRSVFYCGRMLSSQKGTEFIKSNYNDIKKVYSIWICMNVPYKDQYTITRFKMNRENIYGNLTKSVRYDLLESIVICLGSYDNVYNGNILQRMLSTLLTVELNYKQKEEILLKEFAIPTTEEIKGGLEKMCNLSDGIEQRGIEKGIEKGLKAYVKLLYRNTHNLDEMYTEIMQEEIYKDVTKEQVEEIYNSLAG